jgi:hypothetical protein
MGNRLLGDYPSTDLKGTVDNATAIAQMTLRPADRDGMAE